ncbi:zinc finger protein 862-like [Branchiostoma floridae x Branchiostoma japonicum]
MGTTIGGISNVPTDNFIRGKKHATLYASQGQSTYADATCTPVDPGTTADEPPTPMNSGAAPSLAADMPVYEAPAPEPTGSESEDAPPPRKKKKGGKKQPRATESESEEDTPAPKKKKGGKKQPRVTESESEEDTPAPKNKKKGGKKQPRVTESESEEDTPAPKNKKKGGKKQPRVTESESEEDTPAPKKKKGGKKQPQVTESESEEDTPAPKNKKKGGKKQPQVTESESEEDTPAPKNKKKGGKKQPRVTESESEEDTPAPKKKNKKKGGNKQPQESESEKGVSAPKKKTKGGKRQQRETGCEEDAPAPKKQRIKRFQQKWMLSRPWLAFNGTVMWCKWCREQRRDSIWSTGTKNFRPKTLKKHTKGNHHKATVAARDANQPLLVRGLDKAKAKKEKATEAALRTVYWIATEEVANRKYKSLLELQREQGLQVVKDLNTGRNATHDSPTTFNNLLKCLNDVIEEQTAREARASPWVALGVDESTDRSSEKHVVLVIRYVRVHTAELVTTFLRCEKVADGKADTLYRTMLAILGGYDIPVRKVLGLGIDGAAVMASDINGVTGLLHRDNPYTVAIHCVCHRLNLAVSQAAKNIQPVQNTSLLIANVYNYIMQSPNRLAEFKTLVDVLGEDHIKLKNVFDIRWLSMGEAVHSVLRNFKALAMYTGGRAADGDPGAIGIHQQLSSFLPVALLCLLADVLDATNHLSRLFQYRDISFSSLGEQVHHYDQVHIEQISMVRQTVF